MTQDQLVGLFTRRLLAILEPQEEVEWQKHLDVAGPEYRARMEEYRSLDDLRNDPAVHWFTMTKERKNEAFQSLLAKIKKK
jgi:hypothetical protein